MNGYNTFTTDSYTRKTPVFFTKDTRARWWGAYRTIYGVIGKCVTRAKTFLFGKDTGRRGRTHRAIYRTFGYSFAWAKTCIYSKITSAAYWKAKTEYGKMAKEKKKLNRRRQQGFALCAGRSLATYFALN